jgi:hypothetical protein
MRGRTERALELSAYLGPRLGMNAGWGLVSTLTSPRVWIELGTSKMTAAVTLKLSKGKYISNGLKGDVSRRGSEESYLDATQYRMNKKLGHRLGLTYMVYLNARDPSTLARAKGIIRRVVSVIYLLHSPRQISRKGEVRNAKLRSRRKTPSPSSDGRSL